MKKTLFALAASLLVCAGGLQAQDAAVDAATAAPAAVEAPAAAFDSEAYFASLPDVIASWNQGVLVTKKDLLDVVGPAVENAKKSGAVLTEAQVTGFTKQLGATMGQRALFLALAKEGGISGDVEAATKQVEETEKAMNAQVGEGAFQKQLEQLGMTRDEVVQKFVEETIVEKYLEGLDKNLPAPVVTDEEIQAFYDENQQAFLQPATFSAAHILVQFPANPPTDEQKAECLSKLSEIKAKLAADGSNFGDLAKEFSDCPSKEQGGDLGRFPEGSMVPEFEAALKNLAEGEISDPVETQFGYHLIKAGAKTEASIAPFEDAKEQIKQFLENQQTGKAAMEQLNRIRTEAGLKINL